MLRLIISSLIALSAFGSFAQLDFKGSVYARQAGRSEVAESGEYLYLIHSNTISTYKVNQSTGMLKRIQQINTDFGGEIGEPYLSANDKFLYATVGKKINGKLLRTLLMYQVDKSTGKLTFKRNFENDPEFHLEYTNHFSVSPKRNLMFLGDNGIKTLKVYRINLTTGIPEYINEHETDYSQHFMDFHVSDDQRNLYVGGGNSHKEVVAYSLDERTGELSHLQDIESTEMWGGSSKFLISADGKNAYQVGGRDDENVIQYRRDEETGMLSYQKTYRNFRSKGQPIEMHYLFSDRNTDFIYGLHAFGDGDAIHVIARDKNSGNLTYKKSHYDQGVTNKLNGVYQVSFSRDNRFVYASGMWDGALNIFHNTQARKTVHFHVNETKPITNEASNTSVAEESSTPKPVSNSCMGEDISNQEFNAIWGLLSAAETDSKRLDRSLELLEGRCVKVVQAAGLSYLFKSEYKRLEFVKFISYFLHDEENTHMLAEVFQYENMREEVRSL